MNVGKELELKVYLNSNVRDEVMALKQEYQEARDKENMEKENNKEEEKKEEKKEEQPAEVQPSYDYYGNNNSYTPIEPSGDLLEKALSSYDKQLVKRINEDVAERLKNKDNNMKRNHESKTHEEPSRQEIAKDEDEEVKEDEEDKKSEQEEYMNDYWYFEKLETESTFGQNYKNCKRIIILWEIKTSGYTKIAEEIIFDNSTSSPMFSADGKYFLISAIDNKTIIIYDALTLSKIKKIE